MMKLRSSLVALISLSALYGCGGGGGGGGSSNTSPSASTTFQTAQATRNVLQTSATYTASGSSQGNSYSASYSIAPLPDTTFEGQAVKATRANLVVRENGVVIGSGATDLYYTDAPLTFRGGQSSAGYIAATNPQSVPDTSTAPTSNQLFRSDVFSDGSKSQKIGSRSVTFILEPETATTAFVCLSFADFNNSGAQVALETDCFRSDVNGNISGFKLDFTLNGPNGSATASLR